MHAITSTHSLSYISPLHVKASSSNHSVSHPCQPRPALLFILKHVLLKVFPTSPRLEAHLGPRINSGCTNNNLPRLHYFLHSARGSNTWPTHLRPGSEATAATTGFLAWFLCIIHGRLRLPVLSEAGEGEEEEEEGKGRRQEPLLLLLGLTRSLYYCKCLQGIHGTSLQHTREAGS